MAALEPTDLKGLAVSSLSPAARSIVLLVAGLLLGACASQRQLMPTPKVYALGMEQPYADSLPGELRTVDVNVIYATDRVAQPRENGRLDYGIGRDAAMAVGVGDRSTFSGGRRVGRVCRSR